MHANIRKVTASASRYLPMTAPTSARPDYLKKHGLPANPDSLTQHTLVMLSIRGEVQPWDLTSQAHSRFVVNQAETMIDAAISGIGLARPLSYQVVDEIKSGKLVRVLNQFEPKPIPVSLVFTSRKHIPMRTRAFLDIAAEALKHVEGIQYR